MVKLCYINIDVMVCRPSGLQKKTFAQGSENWAERERGKGAGKGGEWRKRLYGKKRSGRSTRSSNSSPMHGRSTRNWKRR